MHVHPIFSSESSYPKKFKPDIEPCENGMNQPYRSMTEMVRKCITLKNEPGNGHMEQCLEY